MSLAISPSLMKTIFRVLIIALIAKIATMPLFFLLPHFGVDHTQEFTINFYHNFKLSKAFALKTHLPKKSNKPVYKLTNLKLKAIYSHQDRGVIAIEEKGKLIFLSTGESFKGYKLIKVEPTKAVFEKNGKHYELYLDEKNLKGKFSISLEEQMMINPDEVKIAVLKRDIDRYRRNFQKIWQNISIQEQIDPKTKKLQGFKVIKVNKNSIFGKIGLQKGDIIIGANNKIFRTYSDVFRIYNNIDKYNSLKLTILRNNQKKDLEYEIY